MDSAAEDEASMELHSLSKVNYLAFATPFSRLFQSAQIPINLKK
jgi:hypothetical protein